MELAHQMKRRRILLRARWLPRLQNQEADDLTNYEFRHFDPKKRIKVLSATELCYLGCANGHIHLYVPAGEYGPILTTLGHQLKRCILPSRHKNISADTNSASVSVLALVTAMR